MNKKNLILGLAVVMIAAFIYAVVEYRQNGSSKDIASKALPTPQLVAESPLVEESWCDVDLAKNAITWIPLNSETEVEGDGIRFYKVGEITSGPCEGSSIYGLEDGPTYFENHVIGKDGKFFDLSGDRTFDFDIIFGLDEKILYQEVSYILMDVSYPSSDIFDSPDWVSIGFYGHNKAIEVFSDTLQDRLATVTPDGYLLFYYPEGKKMRVYREV